MAQDALQKSKWQRRLRQDRLGQRLLIAAILFISLVIVVHFREAHIDVPEAGTRAQRDIIAPVDFRYPDEHETRVSRQESVRDIETIYKLDSRAVEKQYHQFEASLTQNRQWRALLPDVTFEQITGSAELAQEKLLAARFTSNRTLQRLKTLKLLQPNFFSLVMETNNAPLPEEFWEVTEQEMIKAKKYPKAAVIYTIAYFQKINWPLKSDLALQRQFRKEVEKKFPEKYRSVRAGEKIMHQGDLVTASQVTMLRSMREAVRRSNFFGPLKFMGSVIAALIVIFLCGCYFYITQKTLIESVKQLSLYATIVILTLLIAKVTEYFLIQSMNHPLEIARYPLFVPFAAILICILLNFETAFFTSCFLTIILGLSLTVNASRFIAINLLGSIVAILASRSVRKRKEIFIVCGKVWLCCIPLFFVYDFVKDVFWDPAILFDLLGTLGFLALTSILVVGLLPIFESIFHMMTDITLMEYMDPNNELLRRLSVEAPGTYQHCLVVGSIAEAAAQAIGANGLLCRVSTLYHDIGKLANPHYFTENQMGGFNIHQLLTPLESTQVIIAHVTDGEALARKHGLPESFINIIREHHGTTLVYYFYCKQIEQMGGDASHIDENQFRYPGPKPQSKESAIIMMADTVEAASRSLENVNEESLTELVKRLIGEKLSDGQFDDCMLTFKEFGIIKKTIVRMLSVARHLRIKYPEKA
ncbi:MAG: HDIG domain-containing metalloprotein [Chlamydiota bacterium]